MQPIRAIEKRVLWAIVKDQTSITIERMTREWRLKDKDSRAQD
ncbi:hypothetical protein [Bartonella tribocorum]|nr:hypothetical protein [Bartonella tribocorum]